MQCKNCRFENMPGVEACGRCGSSLRLATAVIDVHPPRARPWIKPVRRLGGVLRGVGRLLNTELTPESRSPSPRRIEAGLPDWGPRLWALLAIPGAAQFYFHCYYRGWMYLGTYLTLMVPGVVLWHGGPGLFFFGWAYFVHSIAAVDALVVHRSADSFRQLFS